MVIFNQRAAPDQIPPQMPPLAQTDMYNAKERSGADDITFAPRGIDLTDHEVGCIHAYRHDVNDWILGAVLGRVNKGKKLMLAQYLPVLESDPEVRSLPGTEDELIAFIMDRPDYKTIPVQLEERAVARALASAARVATLAGPQDPPGVVEGTGEVVPEKVAPSA